jgi:heptosyltransferase-2
VQTVSRILIVKWSALGDVAIASALMEDIRCAYPQAELHLNTLPSARGLFADDPRFSKLIVVNVRDREHRVRENLEWVRRVRAEHYDAIVDLQNSDHSRILLSALVLSGGRVPHRLGSRGGFPYTNRRARNRHVRSSYSAMRDVLDDAGIPAATRHPALYTSTVDDDHARRTMREHGLATDRFAVLLPGSQRGGWLKRWGAERYAALGVALLQRGLARIAVVGGPDEADECRRIVAAIEAQAPGGAVHLDMLPLLQIPVVCRAAHCVVANDTGTAHIAAAADRRLVVICGPTDPRKVKPLGANVVALQADLPCVNCYGKTCARYDTPRCMTLVTPDAVIRAIDGVPLATADVRVF